MMEFCDLRISIFEESLGLSHCSTVERYRSGILSKLIDNIFFIGKSGKDLRQLHGLLSRTRQIHTEFE